MKDPYLYVIAQIHKYHVQPNKLEFQILTSIINLYRIIAFIACDSEPALEKAFNITIAPYNFTYNGIKEHFQKSPLQLMNPEKNQWS